MRSELVICSSVFLVTHLGACAFAERPDALNDKAGMYVEFEGTFRSGREVQLENVRQNKGRPVLASLRCISGVMKAGRAQYSHFDGVRVVARGRLYDYAQWVSRDPIAATVDALQNHCGNSHVMVIESVRLR